MRSQTLRSQTLRSQTLRFQTLQAGRGFAALLVVCFHASSTICEDKRFWSSKPFLGFFDFGNAGVYFFFVLSGFIIFAAHARDVGCPETVRNYLVRRFIRVYPMYWIVLSPIVVLYLLKPGISKPELASHSVIANSFLLIGLNTNASLAVAWTLFYEILFYLLFCTAILSRRAGAIILGGWWAICGLCIVVPHLSSLGLYQIAPLDLLFGLGAGVYALSLRLRIRGGGTLAFGGVVLFLSLGIYQLQYGERTNTTALLYGAASAVILLGLVCKERERAVRMPAAIVLLGDASYCIYLVHYPALSLLARVLMKLAGRAHPDIAFVILVFLAAGLGIVAHLVVEKPLLAYLNAIWRRHLALKATGQAAALPV